MAENEFDLTQLEAEKKQCERELANSAQMFKTVRDPSIEWDEKKKTMDIVVERRAAAGRELEKLEKQGQTLAAAILAKQQALVRIGREAMELSLCRAENDEMIDITRQVIQNTNSGMHQVHFGGSISTAELHA